MREIIFKHPKYTVAKEGRKYTFKSRPETCKESETFMFTSNNYRSALYLIATAGEPFEISESEAEIIMQDGQRSLERRRKKKAGDHHA